MRPDASLAVLLHVDDAQLPENGGTWQLSLSDGAASVARGGSAPWSLRLNISTLSRLFVGSLSASQAVEAALLECDRPEQLRALDDALALPEPWTFDRF